jgi:hypothetical protein
MREGANEVRKLTFISRLDLPPVVAPERPDTVTSFRELRRTHGVNDIREPCGAEPRCTHGPSLENRCTYGTMRSGFNRGNALLTSPGRLQKGAYP